MGARTYLKNMRTTEMQIQRYVEHRSLVQCELLWWSYIYDSYLWYVSAAWCARSCIFREIHICLCVQTHSDAFKLSYFVWRRGAFTEALSCMRSLSAHKFEANIKIVGLPFDIVIKRAPRWCGITRNSFAIANQVNAARVSSSGVC